MSGPDAPQRGGAEILLEHITECTDAKAVVVVDGSADDTIAGLFGRMIDRPSCMPMWTADLQQEAWRKGISEIPDMPGREGHHALSDAKETLWRWQWLDGQGSRP